MVKVRKKANRLSNKMFKMSKLFTDELGGPFFIVQACARWAYRGSSEKWTHCLAMGIYDFTEHGLMEAVEDAAERSLNKLAYKNEYRVQLCAPLKTTMEPEILNFVDELHGVVQSLFVKLALPKGTETPVPYTTPTPVVPVEPESIFMFVQRGSAVDLDTPEVVYEEKPEPVTITK